MDVVDVNPLNLTLDEVIALNRARNKAKEEEEVMPMYEEDLDLPIKEEFDTALPKIMDTQAQMIDSKLWNIPGFGSKQIHQRLGYRNGYVNWRFNGPKSNVKRLYTMKTVNRARGFLLRRQNEVMKGVNPIIKIKNPNAINGHNQMFVSPLTRNSVAKFNQMNSFANSSVGARSTVSHRTMYRHSAKACLNPHVQAEMKTLNPPKTPTDIEILESFRPLVDCTNEATHDRFSSYF